MSKSDSDKRSEEGMVDTGDNPILKAKKLTDNLFGNPSTLSLTPNSNASEFTKKDLITSHVSISQVV